MKWLALDTSTELLSVAVGGTAVTTLAATEPGGARASARLIPLVFELLGRAGLRLADLDAIAFGAGPGAFTGLRTACAVAQGLGLGAGRPLLPVDGLLAVAEAARAQVAADGAPLEVLAVLDARMGELYAGRYHWDGRAWNTRQRWPAMAPAALAAAVGAGAGIDLLAGNAGFDDGLGLLTAWPERPRIAALPTAEAMLRLAPALWRAGLAVPPEAAEPHYVRDKVAQTTAERQATQAGAVAGPTSAAAAPSPRAAAADGAAEDRA